ncbi:hypothetical protein E0H26_09810 [Micromonospora zingiberis]|uniref:Uncharacterized protein n=1 Tax=Micromonospora zingiberis TaxID=2053011 RepID=A0A4R0GQ97_9ACTN|nr:hypothetical protein [Micromonospora zingiberis]TCB97889.1 hypothetical protein E0H26_09810 [Micromonospora zingiberis]
MGATDPGSAREEAERLVATLLASARLAAAGPGAGPLGPLGGIVTSVLGHSDAPHSSTGAPGAGFATGTAECCVCPICRGIAALRDPSPEFAERLATGAGDLAAGLASFLRAFTPAEPAAEASDGPGDGRDGDQVWRETTRTGHDSQPAPERDVWSAATRAEDVAVPAVPPVDAAGPVADAVGPTPEAGRPVVPASRTRAGDGRTGPDVPAPAGAGQQGAAGDEA